MAGLASGLVAQAHVLTLRPQRWLLLHYHIFNNAGVTIDYLLERSFGSSLAMVHGPEPDSALHAAEVASFLGAHPEINAVSSHHLRYPKPVIPGVVVCDLCFLRDPLERLWLNYKHLRRSHATEDLGRFSKSRDAHSFFVELIEKHPQAVNDVQVNLLANGGEYTRPVSELDLRAALDVLRQISILGVVDLFDESALAAEYFIRPVFPTFQFQYVRQSADVVSGRHLQQQLDQFRVAAGKEVYDELARLNELDTKLVAHARKEVLRRWETLPNREARIADFRERCSVLQAVHDSLTQPAGQ